MSVGTDAFQGLFLREFLLEDGLREEFNYAQVASWLGELLSQPASVAVQHLLSGSILTFVKAGLTRQAIMHLVKVKNTTLLLRATADFLSLLKSADDNYRSCCRSALCHAIASSFQGHTNLPGIFTKQLQFMSPEELDYLYRLDGGKTLVNVGSVGQPWDGDWRACYVLLDDPIVRFRRVEYDIEETIKKIRDNDDLDDFLGDRLRDGR